MTQYSMCARNFAEQPETGQIKELLNMDPQWHVDDKLLAQNILCSCVYHGYIIVNTSLSK